MTPKHRRQANSPEETVRMPVQHRHSLHASSISSESGPWRILRRNAPDRRGCDAVRCDPSPLSRTENTLKYDRNVLIRSNPPLEVFDPNSSVPSSPPHTSLGPKALQSTPWLSWRTSGLRRSTAWQFWSDPSPLSRTETHTEIRQKRHNTF